MITPLRNSDKFAIAAAHLKRTAPQTFGELETALAGMLAEATSACVHSQPDQVIKLQGRALQLSDLHDAFQNCIATADKLAAKMKERT